MVLGRRVGADHQSEAAKLRPDRIKPVALGVEGMPDIELVQFPVFAENCALFIEEHAEL